MGARQSKIEDRSAVPVAEVDLQLARKLGRTMVFDQGGKWVVLIHKGADSYEVRPDMGAGQPVVGNAAEITEWLLEHVYYGGAA